jgi:hypothetical protein
MKLHINALVRFVQHRIGMTAIAVHMTVSVRGLSDININTWCKLSGFSDQKSHIIVGDFILYVGPFLSMNKITEFFAIFNEKTGVLLPTRSQFPSYKI